MDANVVKRHHPIGKAARLVTVATLMLGVSGTLATLLLPTAAALLSTVSGASSADLRLDRLAIGASSWIALVAIAALLVQGLGIVIEAAVGSHCRRPLPVHRSRARLYRRMVLAACGTALTVPAIGAGPALAAGPDVGAVATTVDESNPDFPSLHGLPLPDLPLSARPRPSGEPSTCVVAAGRLALVHRS